MAIASKDLVCPMLGRDVARNGMCWEGVFSVMASNVKDVIRAGKGCSQGWQVQGRDMYGWPVLGMGVVRQGWSVLGRGVVMDG
jgi:hypothetical protein